MPRVKGHNKCRTKHIEAIETALFNARLIREDVELAELLLKQEADRRELPSAGLERSRELVRRVEEWSTELIAVVESVYKSL